MDPDAIPGMVDFIGQLVAGAVDALTPFGLALTGSLTVLGLVFFGVNIVTGSLVPVAAIARFTAFAAGASWLLNIWGDMVLGSLTLSRNLIGQVVPGWAGPVSGLTMANEISQRFATLGGELSYWDVGGAVTIAIAAMITNLSIVIASLIGLFCEVMLLVGCAVAPVLLPFLAWEATASIGFGALRYLLSSSMRVAVIGITQALAVKAMAAALVVTGVDGTITNGELLTITSLAVVAFVVTLGSAAISGGLVGGFATGGGWSSISHAGSVAAGGVRCERRVRRCPEHGRWRDQGGRWPGGFGGRRRDARGWEGHALKRQRQSLPAGLTGVLYRPVETGRTVRAGRATIPIPGDDDGRRRGKAAIWRGHARDAGHARRLQALRGVAGADSRLARPADQGRLARRGRRADARPDPRRAGDRMVRAAAGGRPAPALGRWSAGVIVGLLMRGAPVDLAPKTARSRPRVGGREFNLRVWCGVTRGEVRRSPNARAQRQRRGSIPG